MTTKYWFISSDSDWVCDNTLLNDQWCHFKASTLASLACFEKHAYMYTCTVNIMLIVIVPVLLLRLFVLVFIYRYCRNERIETLDDRDLLTQLCEHYSLLNTKTYQFTKLCKSDWVTYPKQQKSFFSEKLIERTDEKAVSSFLQLFWKKDFCCFGYVTQSLLHSFVNW